MEKYTISKESVLALAATSQTARLILAENFPDAFKEEMVIGKWYKGIKHNFLVNYQGNDGINYGFWGNSRFKNDIFFGKYWVDECREATPEEVETALIAEAKKRGFVNGAIGNNSKPNNCNLINHKLNFVGIEFDAKTNELIAINNDSSFWTLFKDGKWAEIITEETKVITMDKAVKILSKKYGKQVEIK